MLTKWYVFISKIILGATPFYMPCLFTRKHRSYNLTSTDVLQFDVQKV